MPMSLAHYKLRWDLFDRDGWDQLLTSLVPFFYTCHNNYILITRPVFEIGGNKQVIIPKMCSGALMIPDFLAHRNMGSLCSYSDSTRWVKTRAPPHYYQLVALVLAAQVQNRISIRRSFCLLKLDCLVLLLSQRREKRYEISLNQNRFGIGRMRREPLTVDYQSARTNGF